MHKRKRKRSSEQEQLLKSVEEEIEKKMRKKRKKEDASQNTQKDKSASLELQQADGTDDTAKRILERWKSQGREKNSGSKADQRRTISEQSTPEVDDICAESNTLDYSSRPPSMMDCNVFSPTIMTTPRSRNECAASEGNPNSTEPSKIGDQHTDLQNAYVKKKLKTYLQRHFRVFKQNIEPDQFADVLVSNNVLTDDEGATIDELKDRQTKNEFILMYTVKFLETDKASGVSLVQILENAFKTSGSEYLFQDFTNSGLEDDESEDNKRRSVTDNREWRRNLDAFFRLKSGEINPVHIRDLLLSREVISFAEYEDLNDFGKTRTEKLSLLIDFLKDKTVFHYKKFVQIIKEEYPSHIDGFNEDNLMETKIVPKQTLMKLKNVHVERHAAQDISLTAKSVLTLNARGEGSNEERNVVERLSKQPNPEVMQQTVEFAAQGIANIKFSSIDITLKALSRRSQMKAFEKCKESSHEFQKLVQSVFLDQDIKSLREKGISEVHVKLTIPWPECPLTKRDIVNNFCYLKENMPDVTESMATFNGLNLNSIKEMKTKAERNAAILMHVVNSGEDVTLLLYKALKDAGATQVLEAVQDAHHKNAGACCCRLSKSQITTNFTVLTERMTHLQEILTIFAQFADFKEDDRADFKLQLAKLKRNRKIESTDSKDCFLRKILDMNCNQVECCLLEEALYDSGQEILLQQVLKQEKEDADLKTFVLQREDIDRNQHILLNELEPRRFVGVVKDSARKTAIEEKADRRERCRLFLEALKVDTGSLKEFGIRLRDKRFKHITRILLEGRKQGSAEEKVTKADIERNRAFLKEEINPRKFLKMLCEARLNEVKNSDEVIEKVLSSSPATHRNSYFIEFLLDGPDSDTCMLDLFFSRELNNFGLSHINSYLINSRDVDPRQERIKEAIIDLHSDIVEEIEPERLRPVFTEREVISSKDFDEILCKGERRQDRAILLLTNVLDGKPSKAHCLVSAMEAAGYSTLAQKISVEMDKYHSCPRLFKLRNCTENMFTVEGDLQLQDPCDPLHQSVASTSGLPLPVVNRRELTEHWVNTSDGLNAEDIKDNRSGHSKRTCPQFGRRKRILSRDEKRCRQASARSFISRLSPASLPCRNTDECFDVNCRSARSQGGMGTNYEKENSDSDDSTILFGKDDASE